MCLVNYFEEMLKFKLKQDCTKNFSEEVVSKKFSSM